MKMDLQIPIVLLVTLVGFTWSLPAEFQQDLDISKDAITLDLYDKYGDVQSEDFWAPLSFSTTSHALSRELVGVVAVRKEKLAGNYLKWQYGRIGFDHFLIALNPTELHVFGSQLNSITSIQAPSTHDQFITFSVLPRWNFYSSSPQLLIVVGTKNGRIHLYTLDNSVLTRRDSTGEDGWKLQYSIQVLYLLPVGLNLKVILQPASPGLHSHVYNLVLNETETQLWYHQLIPSPVGCSVKVAEVSGDSQILIGTHDLVRVYVFNGEKYDETQVIPLAFPSISLISFSIAYRHYILSLSKTGETETFVYNGHEYTHESSDFLPPSSTLLSQITSVTGEDYRDEGFLITKDAANHIQVLSFDGTQFRTTESLCSQSDVCFTTGNLQNGIGFDPSEFQSIFIVPTEQGWCDVVRIEKKTEESHSPFYRKSVDLINDFKGLFSRYRRWEDVIIRGKNAIADSLSLTSPNLITGNWTLHYLSTNSEITIPSNLNYRRDEIDFDAFEFVHVPWEVSDFGISLSVIDEKLENLKARIEDVQRVIEDAVPLESITPVTLDSEHTVHGSFNSISKLNILDLVTNSKLNQEPNATQFLDNLILLEPHLNTPSSIVEFHSGRLAVTNLKTDVLNRVPLASVGRLSYPNTFSCYTSFKSKIHVSGKLLVHLVNGLKFAEEIIKINDVFDLQFLDGVVARERSKLSSPVHGIQLDPQTFQNILLKPREQQIPIPFKVSRLEGNANSVLSYVNGLNYTELMSTIVCDDWIGRPIYGEKTLEGELEATSATIEKQLNSYAFPNDLVTTRLHKLRLGGHKNFNSLYADKMNVAGNINGIKAGDILGRLESATLRTCWTFESPVLIVDNLSVKGLVDGSDIETLEHNDLLTHSKSVYRPIADIVFQGDVVTFRNLKIGEKIDGKRFDELFGNILSFDSRYVQMSGLTTFRKGIQVVDLQIDKGKLNELNLNEIMTIHTSQNISGHLTFGNGLKLSGLSVLGTFDGIHLSRLLLDAFRLSTSRIVSSDLSFEEILANHIRVVGAINEFQHFPDKVALTSGRDEQIFDVDVEMSKLRGNNLRVTDNFALNGKRLGNFEFDNWMLYRKSLSGSVQFLTPVRIAGNVKILGGTDVRSLNSIDLQILESKVLRSDYSRQVFLGNVELKSSLVVQNGVVTFEKGIGMFNLNEIIRNSLPLYPIGQPQTIHISGHWIFQNSLLITSDLEVVGKTCGVDLVKLDADSVRSGESGVYIHGQIEFAEPMEIIGEAYLNQINGEKLLSLFINLNSTQHIYSPLTQFNGNVFVTYDLLPRGTLNGISIPWFGNVYKWTNDSYSTHILRTDVNIIGSIESESLDVDGLIYGRNWKSYLATLLNLNESPHHVRGRKVFSKDTSVDGNLKVNLLNGRTLDDLSSIIFRSHNQIFAHPTTFQKKITSPLMKIKHGDVNLENGIKIGNLDLEYMINTAATFTSNSLRDSLGSLVFSSGQIHGNVDNVLVFNGIQLKELIKLNIPMQLPKLRVKESQLLDSNVEIRGHFSGINLQNAYKNTLTKKPSDVQHVSGLKKFTGIVYIDGNLECLGDFRKYIVGLHGEDDVIHSQSYFTSALQIQTELLVDGTINGVNLDDLLSSFLRNGREETVDGHWEFASGVTFNGSVAGDGELDGWDFDELINQKKSEALVAQQIVQDEKLEFERQCSILRNLRLGLTQRPVRLEFFERHQPIISINQPISRMTYIQNGNSTFILISTDTCRTEVFGWDASQEIFKPLVHNSLDLGQIKDWTNTKLIGVLVYESIKSRCSEVSGVYSMPWTELGSVNQRPNLMKIPANTKFQLVDVQNVTWLVVLDDKRLQFFKWTYVEFDFILEIDIDKSILEFRAIGFGDNEIGILFVSTNSINWDVIQLSSGEKTTLETQFEALPGKVITAEIVPVGSRKFGFVSTRTISKHINCGVQIFELTTRGISLVQRLPALTALSMTWFSLGSNDSIYVSFLTREFGIQIYEYGGISGWREIESSPLGIKGNGILQSLTLPLWDYSIQRPFLLLSNGNSLEIFHSTLTGDSLDKMAYAIAHC